MSDNNSTTTHLSDRKLHPHKKVHWILAHSYFTYLAFFLLGLALDLVFKFRFFTNPFNLRMGFAFLALGSILVIWAQSTSRNLPKTNLTSEAFCRGPYCYTRSPTHWGLFLLILGFGIAINAFFVILFTVCAFLVTRLSFLKKQEEALIAKYGAPYVEYQKKVKL